MSIKYFELLPNTNADCEALLKFFSSFMEVRKLGFGNERFNIFRTWVYHRPMILQYEGKDADKAYFIIKGLSFAFFYDMNGEVVAFRIFKAGEIALIPESFINGKPAQYSLMACGDTRLLEISLSQVNELYLEFPITVMLTLKIVAETFTKDVIKDRMLSLGYKESIRRFYALYPELYGNLSLQFWDMYIARHLNMSPVTFSRLRAELFPFYPDL